MAKKIGDINLIKYRKGELKMKEYNEYNINAIRKLIEKGKKYRTQYDTEEEMLRKENIHFAEYRFIKLGFEYPTFNPQPRLFYRIGEPLVDEGNCYMPSFNFAEDRREDGVSVVTTEWLHSLKSIFFGTYDEKIKEKGVYKIYGFSLPDTGGDDEILIVPLQWAEKTKIQTRNGLEIAVKKIGL